MRKLCTLSRCVRRPASLALLGAMLFSASALAECIDYDDYLHWAGSVGTHASLFWAVDVAGSYAYVTDNGGNLRVVDVSNPAFPEIVGQADTPARPMT